MLKRKEGIKIGKKGKSKLERTEKKGLKVKGREEKELKGGKEGMKSEIKGREGWERGERRDKEVI